MKTKRQNWQDRWKIERSEGTATHETGLRVRLEEGSGVALNASETETVLAAEHGAHNAPAMVSRLTREGAQMLIDPYSRGWRGTEQKNLP